MRVSFVYAVAGRAWSAAFELPEGATVADACAAVQPALAGWPEEARAITRYAIFGREAGSDSPLREGDRVECLRTLLRDPKDTRRLRAEQNPLKRSSRGA